MVWFIMGCWIGLAYLYGTARAEMDLARAKTRQKIIDDFNMEVY